MSRLMGFAVLLFVAACAEDQGGGVVNPPVTENLTVANVTPAAGAMDVDPVVALDVAFDRALNPATVSQGFALAVGVHPVVVSAAHGPLNNRVTITAPLLPGTTYQATAGTSIRGAGGEALTQPFNWTFTTRTWSLSPLGPAEANLGLAVEVAPNGTRHMLYWAPAPAQDSLRYAECTANCDVPTSWTGTNLLAVNTGGPLALFRGATGKLHLAYQRASSAAVYYGTCAAGCTTAGNWAFSGKLSLAGLEGYRTIGLAVDASGRLHVATGALLGVNKLAMVYGTCPAVCLDSTHWQALALDSSNSPVQAPALVVSAGGEVHVLYQNLGPPMIHRTCSANCLVATNWRVANIGTGRAFAQPVLRQTSDGDLHAFYPNAAGGVTYAHCGGGCDVATGWHSPTIEMHEAPGEYSHRVAMAVAPSGRIHVLYFGSNEGPLRYATCTTACTNPDSWSRGTAKTPFSGRSVALAVDSDGDLSGAVEDVISGVQLRVLP